MGIYDREYYRERTRGSGWFTGTTPACKWILIANIVCFLLPRFLPDDSVLIRWFAAYSNLIFEKGQVWRLVTATFLHNPDNIWHILGNMLFLWFIGREMEAFYGTKEFLWLYFSAAVVSTLCWAVVDYASSPNNFIPMIGASGAIMAVVSLYTFYNPRREFILFIFPVEMWLLLTIYVVSDLWGLLATRGGSLTAFAAHLGGFGYAIAFWSFDLRLSRLKALLPTGRPRLRLVHPEPKREAPAARPTVGRDLVGRVGRPRPGRPRRPSSPRSSSTPGSTRSSSRSPARAATASPTTRSASSRRPAAAPAASGASGSDMPILVRDARPDDRDAIVAYNAALALETEHKTLDLDVLSRGVTRALADPGRLRYWVAEDPHAGRVVGQAAITREWSDWRDGDIWWLQSVFVDEAYRGRGVFRSLLETIRAAARSTPGVIGLRLYVEAANHRAQATYRALGLVPEGYEVYGDLWIGQEAPRPDAAG